MYNPIYSYYKEIYEEDEMPDLDYTPKPMFYDTNEELETQAREFHKNWYSKKKEQNDKLEEKVQKKREEKLRISRPNQPVKQPQPQSLWWN